MAQAQRSVSGSRADTAVRILIVDDHRLFADALQPVLEARGMSATVATDASAAMEVVASHRPHAVLLDLRLGTDEGIELGKRLIASDPGLKLIALTGASEPGVVRDVVKAGFHGFVTKDTPIPQLLGAIGAVLDGQLVIPQRLVGAATGARSPEQQEADLLASQLTPRQWDVLHLLVEGASTREIASRLTMSSGTVRTHVHMVLTKLQVHTRLEAVAFAVRHGLVKERGVRAR